MPKFLKTISILLVVAGLLSIPAISQAQASPPSCETDGAVTTPATQTGLVADCEVLLAAKETLVGTGSLNWSAGLEISAWDGVTVDHQQGRVTGIDLREKLLTGQFPEALANLSHLRVLYLNHNRLTGPIPSGINSLASLRVLDLGQNRLTGMIPPELGGLTEVRALDLADNRLTGMIPGELGSLANLTSLDLGGNRLAGPMPDDLGNLFHLTRLDLSRNRLTGPIPAWLRPDPRSESQLRGILLRTWIYPTIG